MFKFRSLFRRKDSRKELEDDDQAEGYVPTSPASPIALSCLFAFAVGGLIFAEARIHNPILKQVAEHTASALIVACVIGFSYELLVHRYRAKTLRNMLHKQREKMYDALRVYMLTTPKEILNLLEEIAQQTNEVPTLYTPARKTSKNSSEYTFARKIRFFDTLIDVRRKDVIEVLRDWIGADKHINLRFLATDFIGKYQLSELQEEVRLYALRGERCFNHWKRLNPIEQSCTLNYMWAASRCERPKYQWLKDRLLAADDLEIQNWILFVPQQMPEDRELADIIKSYLELQRHAKVSSEKKQKQSDNLVLAARGLAALERHYVVTQEAENQHDARKILVEFASLFESSSNLDEVEEAWRDIGVPKELKNARTKNAPLAFNPLRVGENWSPHVLNIAHRGARAFAPENTLPAFEKAKIFGCPMFELDVHMSKDGVLIVHHDDNLTRCTDVEAKFPGRRSYYVSDYTHDELLRLDAGSWYTTQLSLPPAERQDFLQTLTDDEIDQFVSSHDRELYASGKVKLPTLQQALEVARAADMLVNIEIKTIPRMYSGLTKAVVELVNIMGLAHRVLISSFDHEQLVEVRRLSNLIATGVLTSDRLTKPVEYLKLLDADAYNPGCNGAYDSLGFSSVSHRLDSHSIKDVRGAGRGVNVWTCNDKFQMQELIAAGATGVITDFPNRFPI